MLQGQCIVYCFSEDGALVCIQRTGWCPIRMLRHGDIVMRVCSLGEFDWSFRRRPLLHQRSVCIEMEDRNVSNTGVHISDASIKTKSFDSKLVCPLPCSPYCVMEVFRSY